MANQINVIAQSGRQNGNTGVAKVVFDMKKMKYPLLLPKGTVIAATQLADPKAFLNGKLMANLWGERFQLLQPVVGIEPVGEAAKTETADFGNTRTVMESVLAWMVTFWNGGKDFHTAIRRFNGMYDAFDFAYVDENNVLCGTLIDGATTIAEGIKGYSLSDLFTDTIQQPTGSAGASTKTRFALADSSEFNDRFAFFPLGFPVAQLKSVVDVDLGLISNDGSGVLTIAPRAGAENLVEVFPTVLNASGLWSTIRQDTGATVPISGVTAVAGMGFRLTHTVTGIPAGTPLQTRFADLTTLKTAGVVGYESDAINWVAP